MPTWWYYQYCWAWSSILKVLKVISLQCLKKEVRKGVNFLHADENQSFYKLRLLFLIEVARYVQSTPSRKLVRFLQRVLQPLWCSVLMLNIQIFYGGPAMFIVTCFLAHLDCRNFLPEHDNKIITQQLCGEELPSSLPLLQVDVFQEKQGILQQIILCSSNKPKKVCIRPSDTNNFTQSLTRKYHHSATESLYCLCGAKISWTLTLAGVSYQFGFVHFPICLQCKISGSSVFSIFFHEVSQSKKSDGS